MKPFVLLILAVLAGGVLLLTADWKGKAGSVEKIPATPVSTVHAAARQRPEIIDGAANPELIPDRVAYSLLFRLIANRKTAEEKSHIRAYIRQIGLADSDITQLSMTAL